MTFQVATFPVPWIHISDTFPITRIGGINENITVNIQAHFLYTGNLVCQIHFLQTDSQNAFCENLDNINYM